MARLLHPTWQHNRATTQHGCHYERFLSRICHLLQVNPTLRAAYLSRNPQMKVTLVLPWLNAAEQDVVYPEGVRFQQPAEQVPAAGRLASS